MAVPSDSAAKSRSTQANIQQDVVGSPDSQQQPTNVDGAAVSLTQNGKPSESPPKDKDADNLEDASLSPTLTGAKHSSPTGTSTNLSPASTKPPSVPATSQPINSPPSNGSAPPKAQSGSRNPKHSFFSKLIHILVPCVGASSRAHPIDLDNPPITQPKEKVSSPQAEQANRAASSDARQVESTPPAQKQVEPNVVESVAPPPPEAPDNVTPKEDSTLNPVPQPPASTSSEPVIDESNSPFSPPPPEPAQQGNVEDGDDSERTSFTDDDDIDRDDMDEDDEHLIGGTGIPIGPDGLPRPLLPPIAPHHVGRKCLILDLDETLVHSSFKSIQQADYVVPVEIEYNWHNVYVIKRPGVDNFLKKMGEIYEVVVFTASLSKYADPVLDKLDVHQVVSHRLFRESCYNHKGNYVKDLSQLGRPIADTIILDNSPASYIFHPNNAVPVSSWFNDPHDTELTDLVPFLADLGAVDDVRGVLDGAR
ncbi:hypothetical protein AX16_005208 [Volvariella volvacea WC 439]|nr:hypothetical protein AX16_005208 [Volvariella volvacea WC 439]